MFHIQDFLESHVEYSLQASGFITLVAQSGRDNPISDAPDIIQCLDTIGTLKNINPATRLEACRKMRDELEGCLQSLNHMLEQLEPEPTTRTESKDSETIVAESDEFKQAKYLANSQGFTSKMVSNGPQMLVVEGNYTPYSDTLNHPVGPFFGPPDTNIETSEIERRQTMVQNHKLVGYREVAIPYEQWNAVLVANKIRDCAGRVYQHADNGRRHSILDAKQSHLVIYEQSREFQLGVIVDSNFYAIYISANGHKLYLSRVPQDSLDAKVFNYVR